MAAHLEKCQYFDHRKASNQFSYCFVQPGHEGNSNNHDNHKDGHEDSNIDQIVLECKMSDENETDTETETETSSSSNSEPEVLDAEN